MALMTYGPSMGTIKPLQPQPASNLGWITGKTTYNPQGLFGTNLQPKVQQNAQPNYNFSMAPNPVAGMTQDPAPSMDVASAMPNPWAQSPTFTDPGPQNQDIPMGGQAPTGGSQIAEPMPNPIPSMPQDSTPTPAAPNTDVSASMPNPWAQSPTFTQAPYQPPAPMAGPESPGLNTQYATLDNIQPYMNPYLDQIIAKGNNAIQSSAAAKGLLGSSATLNNIGDWTSQATQNAYTDARNAFNGDRGYMTDQYWKNRGAGTQDFWDTYNANWDQYKYGNADYQGRLGDYYSGNQGIVNNGMSGANATGSIYSLLGNALAGLYGDQGNTAASGIMGGSKANQGFIGNILGLLGGL